LLLVPTIQRRRGNDLHIKGNPSQEEELGSGGGMKLLDRGKSQRGKRLFYRVPLTEKKEEK